ncbi:hypothetical protein [Mucilaginibacter ginsenosidivorax]|uniref:DUF218 domain-containing protein n=1 Tax=Mucilaginibacter ginsenosidivorax TaxID=862126 RepID=A0A5B8W517_9SPHI|nr:hypothetical protein [Mucilaginibacter ginsenosidivorax]QEC78964.1 hypothetical protein FSB76_24560 [Mucilaginibacter ginsenosidivorax]
MIFFAKSNYLLEKHKEFYEIIRRAVAVLKENQVYIRRVNKELDSDVPYPSSPSDVLKVIENGLEDDVEKFNQFCKDMRFEFAEQGNPVQQLERYLLTLKLFQGFEGKINFEPLLNIFNYSKEVYDDKMSRFSLLPDFDKKFIPDFMASSFALLWFNRCIHNNIRRPLEQYLTSLMSNLNYQQFSSGAQLKDLVDRFFPDNKALIYVLGACPENFKSKKARNIADDEYYQILVQRLNTANKVSTFCGNFMEIEPKQEGFFVHADHYRQINVVLQDHPNESVYLNSDKDAAIAVERNITRDNIGKVMTNFYDELLQEEQKLESIAAYDLIIVTSTFHIFKTALEVERYFFRNNITAKQPKNVVIIGDESFYDLMSHCDDKINKKRSDRDKEEYKEPVPDDDLPLIRKKKVKNFMFEIFQHALDKNSNKT